MQPGSRELLFALWLDKPGLAAGEWWRLLTPVLVHGGLMHLLFNMYFLYLVGPLIEELYGTTRFLLIYGLTAAAGSAASFAVGGPAPSVGASGAIFGLCGVLVAVSAIHRPVLDRRGRAIMSQIGVLVLINLAIGFGLGALVGANIDNAAHVGGLLAGIWLGLALRPIRSTLASFWQRPAAPGGVMAQSSASARRSIENAMRLLAVAALAALIVAAVLLGPA
jgi:membrane associated rhomboid family serine protease